MLSRLQMQAAVVFERGMTPILQLIALAVPLWESDLDIVFSRLPFDILPENMAAWTNL